MMSNTSRLFTIVTVIKDCDVQDFSLTRASILSQDFPDWEWIIKDCASMYEVLNLPIDGRIIYLNRPDRNIYDAMNQAVESASGEYVLFINAGDYIYENSTLRTIQSRLVSKEVSFWYGDVLKPYSFTGKEVYKKSLTRFYLSGRTICHQAWVLKTEVLRNYPYLIDYNTGEDILYQIRLVLGKRLSHAHLNVIVSVYKGGGISQRVDNIRYDKLRRDQELKKHLKIHEYYMYKTYWNFRSLIARIIKRIL